MFGPELIGYTKVVALADIPDYIFTEEEFLQQTFSPEGLCARCREGEIQFYKPFVLRRDPGPDLSDNLGFCSTDCEQAFVRGVNAAKTMRAL